MRRQYKRWEVKTLLDVARGKKKCPEAEKAIQSIDESPYPKRKRKNPIDRLLDFLTE